MACINFSHSMLAVKLGYHGNDVLYVTHEHYTLSSAPHLPSCSNRWVVYESTSSPHVAYQCYCTVLLSFTCAIKFDLICKSCIENEYYGMFDPSSTQFVIFRTLRSTSAQIAIFMTSALKNHQAKLLSDL